jgi:predicted DNA-binding protein (MmcQ/YjbR family)
MKSGTKSKPVSGEAKAMSLTPLMDFCRKLPHVTEDTKWGNDLCFSIGGKMFCVFDKSGGLTFSFKTTPAMFSILTKKEGIIPAPYVARYHWVMLEGPTALPTKQIQELIRESYHLVSLGLPAKVRRQFESSK